MHGDCLPAPDDVDLLITIMRKNQRAPERGILRLVTANDGVIKIERVEHNLWLLLAEDPQVALLHFSRELAVRQYLFDKHRWRFFDVVMLTIHERQKARLLFFNRADFDAVNQRQGFSTQALDRLAIPRVSRIRILHIEHMAAVIGIFLQHNFRAAHPVLENVWTGADRMGHGIAGIAFDRLACDRHDDRQREKIDEVVIRLTQLERNRVFVEYLHALDCCLIVVLAALLCGRHKLIEPDDPVFEQPRIRAAIGRIAKAFDRVFHILCDQLARLTLEDRIVGKIDAGFDAKREARTALLANRNRFDNLRHYFHRARQPVIGQQGIENVFANAD